MHILQNLLRFLSNQECPVFPFFTRYGLVFGLKSNAIK